MNSLPHLPFLAIATDLSTRSSESIGSAQFWTEVFRTLSQISLGIGEMGFMCQIDIARVTREEEASIEGMPP